MKKVLSTCLIGTVIAVCLTGCNTTVDANADWKMDKENHWTLSESGDRTNLEAHKIEGDTCSVCGAVIHNDDGAVEVKKYNENEDTVLWITYDSEDGSPLFEKTYTHEYNENNVKTGTKEYENGVLLQETTYAVTPDGESSYEATQTYYEDNTTLYVEFDDHGEIVREKHVDDADGSVLREASYEFVYDDEGLKTYHKYIVDGDVTEECEYAYSSDKTYTYKAKWTQYDWDGGKKVTTYNETGIVQSVTLYDANGNEVK